MLGVRCIHKTIFSRSFSISQKLNSADESYKVVVLGGGSGGLSMASYLSRKFPYQVAVVEPSQVRTYLHMCYYFSVPFMLPRYVTMLCIHLLVKVFYAKENLE